MPHSMLIDKLKNHEDNFIERKPEGVNAAEIRKTVVALANSVSVGSTGILFIGIHNDGRIQGVKSPDKLQMTVREQCERVCYPPIVFSTEVLNVENKSVLAVVIPPSQDRPPFSGPAFVRRGSESVASSPELFDELIASRNDKVAAILRMRGGPVSVICIQHKLGSTERVDSSGYRTRSECVIESCTPHIVRLKDIGTDRFVTEPIGNITIGYDEVHYRHMLIVRGN